MIIDRFIDTEEEVELDVIREKDELNRLILFNDDVNTFEWVIHCLMKYCGHDSIQAEQCAYIVHYKGLCAVKEGTLEELKPICEVLLEKGLSAEIN
ncbi:MAG: ATP-dependent Clp protease adaptor ClpS [Bacteroidetes bacterium]|nr:ATP-dependent Clp protease adaptor ClpS [Bacteroidota bacterium]